MGIVRYASHGDVVKDPAVPVPKWSLNELGRGDAERLAAATWAATVDLVISSAETKAQQMAAPFAATHGLAVDVRPGTGEIDRSATGFVPHERHEQLADQLFAEPERSASGWERAIDAQGRLLAALDDVLASGSPNALVVGHGGVGTLLWCALSGRTIARSEDQPGPGHVWAFDIDSGVALHPWRRIE